jgi:hypothetical protein
MDDQTVIKVIETLGRLDERTERIEREVVGNGQPGLKQRVEDLEAAKNRTIGGIGVIGAIGTFIWGGLEYIFHFRK